MQSVLSYIEMISLLDRGFVSRKSNLDPATYAIEDGLYIGCPGKDMYRYLMACCYLPIEYDNLVYRTAILFPEDRNSRCVQYSCFLRYIYGCFDKHGCLLSHYHKNKMISNPPDWTIPDKFVRDMLCVMEDKKIYYGMIMCKEARAHRYGDLAVIYNDSKYLDTMLSLYKESEQMSKFLGIVKNICSTNYWAMRYMFEFGCNSDLCMHYAYKFFDAVNEYNPGRTTGVKVSSAINIIRLQLSKNEWKKFKAKYQSYTAEVLTQQWQKLAK